jgi:hypothetical protein
MSTPGEPQRRFLIHNRDSIFSEEIDDMLTSIGLTVLKTPVRPGNSVSVRPDLVATEPLYLGDPTVAGGRRINPTAFTVSPELRQGGLGRNTLQPAAHPPGFVRIL